MNINSRLLKLEQAQVDYSEQWLIETVTRNELGEMVVVDRYQYVADKGLVICNEH